MDSNLTQNDVAADSLQESLSDVALLGRRTGSDRREYADRRRGGGPLYRARLPSSDGDRRRQDRRESTLAAWMRWLRRH